MKQKRTYLILLLIVALLCLGIAYAEITGVTLTINGNVSASITSAERPIDVAFTAVETVTGSKGTVTAEVAEAGATTVEFKVEGLTTEKDTASLKYTITNRSSDIAAKLQTPVITCDNGEWFKVTCTDVTDVELAKNGVEGNTTTVTVTVELLKTPVDDADVNAAKGTVEITIEAEPVANS